MTSSSSITQLVSELCESQLAGLSWKGVLGGAGRVSRRKLKRRAYGALLPRLFQDPLVTKPNAPLPSREGAPPLIPARNKVLMLSFNLRVSGRGGEEERLEELLGGLVHLAGSVHPPPPPPPPSHSRDFFCCSRIFSFLLQLKHMVWTLRDVWFHLKRAALVKGAGSSVQFRQLQLYRHEMQHFVKVIQGYIANQILHVTWSEFRTKLGSAANLDDIHRTHADYLNRAIFRGLLTEKAAPVMNIIHSIFSLILKFRAQLISQPWSSQQGAAEHPSFGVMQQSYRTFKYYSHFLFKVVTKLVNRGYQPHLEDFLLRINFNSYYQDS